jgi:probable HAF family extracellular repeat protein
MWKSDEVKELPIPSDDPDAWTFGINDRGQVVGASGPCAALNPDSGVYILSRHALLWDEEGRPTDLGSLGGSGTVGPDNIGLEVNNEGQVVGTSNLKGDVYFHAYLWTLQTGPQDLGTLPGIGGNPPDVNSAGLGIDDRGEVVGASFDTSGNLRAYIWRNGVMTDLNTLIPVDSPLFLIFAHGVSDRGAIVGFALTTAGDVHAFLATPSDLDQDESAALVESQATQRRRPVMSENARTFLQQYLRRHYHMDLPQ